VGVEIVSVIGFAKRGLLRIKLGLDFREPASRGRLNNKITFASKQSTIQK
jgi:hypothetical protein